MAQYAHLPVPDIGIGESPPDVSIDEYRARIAAARTAMSRFGLDVLVVYGDREYFGNLYHLTGIDGRFEEGILVLTAERSTLLLGNENLHVGPTRAIGHAVVLWQELSPAGQRRDAPVSLELLLRQAGVEAGCAVGVTGQKTLSRAFFELTEQLFSAPTYLIDALRSVVSVGSLVDAQHIFTDPRHGLRSVADAHDIARFEFGASLASRSVMRAMQQLTTGTRADELSDIFDSRGVPANAHAMLNYGDRVGLYSPGPTPATLGDTFQIAQSLRGGLTARVGLIASGERDLTPGQGEIFNALALNYFDVVAAWHETVGVGAASATVFETVDAIRDDDIWRFALNPGHHLHYEEWNHSTFWRDDPHRLRSGSMLQCDVIPVPKRADVAVNIEDGVVLADEQLRNDLANFYPLLWERVEARRAFMRDETGVCPGESVLPMSSIPLWHTPYILDPNRNLTR